MKYINYFIRRIFLPTCAIYTVLTLSINIFMTAISSSVEKPALNLSSCVMLFAMAFLVSLSTLIFEIKKLPLFLQTVLNFVATLVSVAAVSSFGSYEMDVGSLLLVIIYTFLYLIIALPIIFIKGRIKNKQSEDKEYTSMFGDK